MITYIENGYYVAEFKASELKTERRFIDTFWEAFNIPYEKIYNLNTLDDCMKDLIWIDQQKIKIKIDGYNNYVKKGGDLDFLKSSLYFYRDFWSKKKDYIFIIEFN
jgi:hypothetical protein